MPAAHVPLEKLVAFPRNYPTYRLCTHEIRFVVNLTGGPPPYFLSGIEGPLLQLLMMTLGIQFDFYVPADDKWGMPDENNNWSGCPGMIQRKEVDVAMGAMLQNYWSFQFSYQSISYRDEGAYFVSKWPDYIRKPYVIFQTFEINAWISILISLLVLALAYYFVMGKKYSYGTQLFSRVAELLLQEPIVKIRRVVSQEILVLVWSLAVLFLTLSYMAVILTIIMLPKTEPPINNEDKVLEAIKSGKYKAAIPNDMPMFLDNLLSNARPSFKKIGEKIRDNNWKFDIDETNFERYLKNNYLIASSVHGRQVSNPLGNPIIISDDPIYFARLCILTQKDFHLRHKLDAVLMRIFESGIYKKHYDHDVFQRRLKDDLHYTREENTGVKVLSMNDLQSAFYVLCLGHLVSLITFAIEIVVDKIKNKSEENDESFENRSA